MLTRRRIRVLALIPLLALGSIGLPSAASAADAQVFVNQGQQLISFTAAAGQSNELLVRQTFIVLDSGVDATQYVFNDTQPINPGEQCTRPDPADETRAVCVLIDSRDPWPNLEVRLGDEDDRLKVAFETGDSLVYGGAGNDEISSNAGVRLYGQDGDDVLTGYSCQGGGGADRLIGCHVADGAAGDDTITGTSRGDELRGGLGRDVIRGGPGNDLIWGNSGNDMLFGNSGRDTISGGPGVDTISGGPGADKVTQ